MNKLRATIEKYGRWSVLEIYIDRIEAHIQTDFSHSVENSKALLETIGKEICENKNEQLGANPTINNVLRTAFSVLGIQSENYVKQISTSLANIGQNIGELRNNIGISSHGKTIEELKQRNDSVDEFTKVFLMETTVSIANLLINLFETSNPRIVEKEIKPLLLYGDNEEFNVSWDELYGDFKMADYEYTASEILFGVDYSAYESELNNYEFEEVLQ